MGMTLTQKIMSRHVGHEVKVGEIVLAKIDATMSHDANRPLALEAFEDMGGKRLFDPSRVVMLLDHFFPAPGQGAVTVHNRMRDFCRKQGCILYEGEGVCHAVMTEKGHVLPGDLVIGSDSHTCTYGGLGALAIGVGSADMAVALITGKLWFMVPETIKMQINGPLPPGVFAKDIILHIIASITTDGATYQAVEFSGDVIDHMGMDGRFTLCNMAVEMGAKAALIAPDETAITYARARATRQFTPEYADRNAEYSRIMDFNVSNLSPYVAKPHNVDNGVPIEEALGTPINQANLNSCTAGRIDDLREAAKVLRGRKIAPGVRLLVVPASREVYRQALEEGLLNIFHEAGGHMGVPNCLACGGEFFGALSDGEVVITSANRNFRGRLGNPNSSIYLASPATVAASAVEGKIADPRQYFS
jgi:3-isopropylmalate/(R)-2-methylmalate dehydratase large subunit